MDSILTSVKKKLGIPQEYTVFDDDLIDHINTAFFNLYQLGVGPSSPFKITGDYESWSEFSDLETVRSYVYLKVKILFDPPSAGTAIDACSKLIAEYEWRLNVAVDPENQTSNV